MSLTARSGQPARRGSAAPQGQVGQASSAPLPLLVAGAAAGAAAAGVSYLVFAVVALGAWMLDPGGTQQWSQMLEVASFAWLAGLGLAPTVGGVTFTLLPLGFSLLAIVALVASSRWAAEASAVARRGEALAVAVSAAFTFAAVAAIVAALSRSLDISPLRAAISGGVLALIVSAIVVLHRARLLRADRIPGDVRDVVAASVVALLCLLAVAALACAIAVILHVDEVTALLVELDPGVSGVLLLAVLTLGYLPLALVWTTAYLVGPGVALGVGSVLSPFAETASTSLPGFPLLAAVPGQAPEGAFLFPLVGVAAGAVAGLLLRRRGHVAVRGALLAAATAALAGIAVSLASWLASGSLGETALVGMGPAPLAVGLAVAVLVAVGAVAVAAWPGRSSLGGAE